MSDLMKKTALMALVVSTFSANADTEELHVTEDGNCFLPTNKSYAELHARRTKQKVQVHKRKDFEAEIDKYQVSLEKAAADKAANEKADADKAAKEKAAAEKEAAEKAAAAKKEAEEAEKKKAAEEKAAAKKAADEKKAAEKKERATGTDDKTEEDTK